MMARQLVSLIVVLVTLGVEGRAEGFAVLLRLTNSAGISDTVWFGAHTNPPDCNFECPPPPPADIFGIHIWSNCSWCADSVLAKYTSSSQVDTFQMDLNPGDGGFPLQLSWSDVITHYNGTVKLVDLFNGIIVGVDMKSQTSAYIPSLFTQLRIIASEPNVTTDVNDDDGIPVRFALHQNFPNPFNPTTAIRYDLPTESFVTLRVYDVLGREVATLVHETKEAGTHSVNWSGENVPSGLYFYRIQTQGFHQTKKMFLLR